MKLNYDLVRSILFKLEEMIYIDDNFRLHTVEIDAICAQFPKLNKGEILYTLIKLSEGGYIELSSISINLMGEYIVNGMDVKQITFKGHQYIDSIRDNKIWIKIKEKAANLSFSIITAAAKKLITNAIP